MKLVATIAIVVVLTTGTARADVEGKCVALVCDSRTKHPGQYSCDTPPCYCNDSCGGGDGSTSSQNSQAMAAGMAKLIGYTALGIGFMFMPGHIAEAMEKDDSKKQTAKQAHAA